MFISLKPKHIFKILISIITLLLIANIIAIATKLNFPIDANNKSHDFTRILVNLFDFNNEISIPTLYSSFTLFFSSILLFLLGFKNRKEGGNYIAWYGLSLIFAFLSIDEMMELHEHLVNVTKSIIPVSGILYYAWVIPYGIGLILLLVIYYKFLSGLPKGTLQLFIISGLIFICGAIVIESFSGLQFERSGKDNIIYCTLYTIEEFFEMFGVALFIYALLSYSLFSLAIKNKIQ